MKQRPNRIGMYSDLQPILDAALISGGGSYTLASYGQAVHWRQRAYKFRKLYAETYSTLSKYDKLTFPRIEPNSSVVEIKLTEARGTFQPSLITPVLDTDLDDDLLDAAAAFAKKLTGDQNA